MILFEKIGPTSRNQTPSMASRAFHSKFVKVSAFILDLNIGPGNTFLNWFGFRGAKPLLKHHFILFQTESGCRFSIEKGPDCILLQSCRTPDDRDEEPIITRQTDGVERQNAKSLQCVIVDPKPKANTTICDIFRWINEDDARELREAYDVAQSNCQNFASRAWSKVSNKDYPHAARFEKHVSSKNKL